MQKEKTALISQKKRLGNEIEETLSDYERGERKLSSHKRILPGGEYRVRTNLNL